jgi:plasmid stabilization system protein ParE
MKLIFLEHAKRDLRWFAALYSKTFPEGRKNAERSLTVAIELLLANPFAGNVVEGKPARQFPVLRTPFVLICSIEGDSIHIIRVWDARAYPVRLNEK